MQDVAGLAARRPKLVVAVAVVLALAGAALALRLSPDAGTDTLVGRGSDAAEATRTLHERFGDDAVVVLVRGDLQKLLLSQDLERLLGLEGCISGNAPAGVTPRGGRDGPCARLARAKPVQVVFGPGTFINESVRQLNTEFERRTKSTQAQAKAAGEAARKEARKRGRSRAEQRRAAQQAEQQVTAQYTQTLLQIAVRYGLTSRPRIDDPNFVSSLVFDATKRAGTPKARFAYLFPRRDTALVQVRLKPSLSDEERSAAIAQVRRAVAMPDWQPRNGARYTVTGPPVVVEDLTGEISTSLLVLLVAALLVMAATLALVFRSTPRLLPLAIALGATAITFGLVSLAGGTLTMAAIAVLPVLIGLAVDYAIQLQARVDEARRTEPTTARAVLRAAAEGAPTVLTAAVATAAGFLVLVLSPVPMVRGFGLLLVVGIAVAFALALAAGFAALVLHGDRRRARGPGRAARVLGPAVGGARELTVESRPGRAMAEAGRRARDGALEAAQRRPGRVVAVGLALAALGWGLDTQTRVESDITKLVPQDLRALEDLQALQRAAQVSGQVDVLVEGDDVTTPAAVRWMSDYQRRVLRRFGHSPERGCGRAAVCPAFSLPDLFSTTPGTELDERRIKALLDAVPPYFSQTVVSADRKAAALAFGIRLMPLDDQKEVIDKMRAEFGDPPEGVRVELGGLAVLAAEANARVSSDWRRLGMLLAGLIAVAVALLAALRRTDRAFVPLVPIVLATGWSALLLFALRVPLNPMSVTLGALVIAISTEFSVLLSERYRAERAAGHASAEALRRTYRSTGSAVLASGATAIAGFAVLVLSDIRMLRDFGFVTVLDLTVSLLGVLVVLPSVLVLAERGELFTLPRIGRPRLRRPRLRRPRLRRRRADAPAT